VLLRKQIHQPGPLLRDMRFALLDRYEIEVCEIVEGGHRFLEVTYDQTKVTVTISNR